MTASPWWSVAGSVIPPLAVAAWSIIQLFYNRKDKQLEREESFEQKRDAAIDREREIITRNHIALIADLRSDIERYRDLLNEKNNDRYRAWDRARFWHQLAWEMRNEASQARQVAESTCRLANMDRPMWYRALDLPPFDDDIKAPLPSEIKRAQGNV